MIKKLCVISQYYPTEKNPIYIFIDVLISQIADMGIECHVIMPTNRKTDGNKSESRIRITDKGNKIYIHAENTNIFVDHKICGIPMKLSAFNTWNRYRCALRAYKKYVKDADAIYAHFWLASGIPAVKLGRKLGLPVFVASGESFGGILEDSIKKMRKMRNLYKTNLSGIIAVSTSVKNLLFNNQMIDKELENRIKVVPNAVDLQKFKVKNKEECRKKLGLQHDAFIVCFVGFFCERKGYFLLSRIIERHPELTGMFIGEQVDGQSPENFIYPGKIEHDKLPDYLNAADIFVLPTLIEGCCNAIIEAMACGLPIVSADRDFNNDIIDDTCAIQVDPTDEAAVEQAMLRLYGQKQLRDSMSGYALQKVKTLSIENRAKIILEFMERNM